MKKSIDLNHDWNQWFKSHWFKSANPGRYQRHSQLELVLCVFLWPQAPWPWPWSVGLDRFWPC